MEIAKDIFFFIGSSLGIFSFVISLIKPSLDDNRGKWKTVTNIIDEDFFKGLEDLHVTRVVTGNQIDTLENVLGHIKAEKDFLRLKFPNRRIFSKHLSRFEKYAKQFIAEINHPVWEKEYPPHEDGRSYSLSKQYFSNNYEDHQEENNEYIKHQTRAADLATQLRVEFRAMEAIANFTMLETVTKRSRHVNRATKKLRNKY